jgi:hypothetical protein
MKKRSNIIKIIGALTALSLLLAIVFAPYRGSHKGTYFDKTLAKMEVNFGGKIINANVDAKNNIAVVNDLTNPTTTSKKRKASASQVYSETLAKTSNESFGKTTSGVLVSNSNTNLADNGKSTNSETTVGIFAPTPIFSTSLIKGSNNQIASAGAVSSTVDLTGVNVSGPQGAGRQSAGAAGGPPPEEGGGVPPPASLPLGNGINFLLILATLYGGWKIRKSFIV